MFAELACGAPCVEATRDRPSVAGNGVLVGSAIREMGVSVGDGTKSDESGFFVETWVKRHGVWLAVSTVFP